MCRASALYGQDFGTVKMEPLSLFYVQSYVPLRAGRCESLPHMKYRTEGDSSYLMLDPASAYSRSGVGQSCLHKPQLDEGVADMYRDSALCSSM